MLVAKKSILLLEEEKLFFWQNLWDQISKICFQKYECDCKKNLQVDSHFQLIQAIAKKYLKLISLYIWQARWLIFKAKTRFQRLKKEVKKQTLKNKKIKLFLTAEFLKANLDFENELIQRNRFLTKYKIPEETKVLTKIFSNQIHKYHLLAKEQKITYTKPKQKNFVPLKKQNLIQQVWSYVNLVLEKYEIKTYSLWTRKKKSVLAIIKIKTIDAFWKKSQLIIYDQIVSQLNRSEIKALLAFIKQLCLEFHIWPFIVFSSQNIILTKSFCNTFFFLGPRNITVNNKETIEKPATLKYFKMLFPSCHQNIYQATFQRHNKTLNFKNTTIYTPWIKSNHKQTNLVIGFHPLNIKFTKTTALSSGVNLSFSGHISNVVKKNKSFLVTFSTRKGLIIVIKTVHHYWWKKITKIYLSQDSLIFYDHQYKIINTT